MRGLSRIVVAIRLLLGLTLATAPFGMPKRQPSAAAGSGSDAGGSQLQGVVRLCPARYRKPLGHVRAVQRLLIPWPDWYPDMALATD